MKKRKSNLPFLTTGLLLIAAALALTVYNMVDDIRAKQFSEDVVSQLEAYVPTETEEVQQIPDDEIEVAAEKSKPVRAMPVRNINGQDYIGTLKLPKYNLELPIISQWSYPRLKIAPCRYTGSVYTDDMIIAAHNYVSHFGKLADAEAGDEVLFTDMYGTTHQYRVILRESLEATAIEEMSAGEWDLTLFTCTVGGTYRVTVRCERVDESDRLSGNGEEDDLSSVVKENRLPLEESQPTVADSEPTVPPVKQTWDTIPLYYQTDYPNTMYGSGTIESSGCSITSLAMVASYMTEHQYLPDELARYFGGRAENNIARLEKGSETLKLKFKKSENWDVTYAGLQQGKVAIALMEANSLFTDSQHFIVLTGLTPDGKILVNDPYEPNYSNWLLRKGFEEGFAPSDVLTGYSGAWLYDKYAMPEEPFIYFEADIDRSNPRYPHIELTFEERKLLAKVVWAEARGEPEEGQQAVAEVVLNRLASKNFPNTLNDVIYGANQFRTVSVLDKAEPYQAQYDAIDRAIYGPYILPEDVVYFATYAVNQNQWGTIGGHIFCYDED